MLGRHDVLHFCEAKLRANKLEPLVVEVGLLQEKSHYAHVWYPDGRETSVASKHLTPQGQTKFLLPLDMQLEKQRITRREDNTETRMTVPVRHSERVRRPVIGLAL